MALNVAKSDCGLNCKSKSPCAGIEDILGSYYILIDWLWGLDGKNFGSKSWCSDLAQWGSCIKIESQNLIRLARSNSVNKLFTIWPMTIENFENLLPPAGRDRRAHTRQKPKRLLQQKPFFYPAHAISSDSYTSRLLQHRTRGARWVIWWSLYRGT